MIKKLEIRIIDLLALFVFGFGFLIAVFDTEMAVGYISFLIIGCLVLSIMNYLEGKNDR